MQRIKLLYSRWRNWCDASVNRSIFGVGISVGVITIMVRSLSVIKEMKVASSFGVGDSLDAFLMALVAPSFVIGIFTGSFYLAFIPVLVGVREKSGHAAAKKLFSSVVFMALTILSVITVILTLSNEWLIKQLASGFDPSKLAKTISLCDEMLPLILLSGVSVLGGAVLNAQKKFALVAAAPLLTPIVIILLLDYFQKFGVSPQHLVAGTLIGAFIELCFVLWGLHKKGYLCLPSWHGLDENSKEVVNQFLPLLAGAFLMSGTLVADQIMSAWLASGSVSALSYANKVPALIIGMAGATLGAAVLPYLSQQSAGQDYRALKHTMVIYSKLIILITVPLTLLVVFFSEELISIIFERGSFSRDNSALVSNIMQYSILQVPAYVLGILFSRLASILSGNKYLLYGSIISLMLKVVLNYLLMNLMGVAGIALSTSIVYLVATGFLYWITVTAFAKKA